MLQCLSIFCFVFLVSGNLIGLSASVNYENEQSKIKEQSSISLNRVIRHSRVNKRDIRDLIINYLHKLTHQSTNEEIPKEGRMDHIKRKTRRYFTGATELFHNISIQEKQSDNENFNYMAKLMDSDKAKNQSDEEISGDHPGALYNVERNSSATTLHFWEKFNKHGTGTRTSHHELSVLNNMSMNKSPASVNNVIKTTDYINLKLNEMTETDAKQSVTQQACTKTEKIHVKNCIISLTNNSGQPALCETNTFSNNVTQKIMLTTPMCNILSYLLEDEKCASAEEYQKKPIEKAKKKTTTFERSLVCPDSDEAVSHDRLERDSQIPIVLRKKSLIISDETDPLPGIVIPTKNFTYLDTDDITSQLLELHKGLETKQNDQYSDTLDVKNTAQQNKTPLKNKTNLATTNQKLQTNMQNNMLFYDLLKQEKLNKNSSTKSNAIQKSSNDNVKSCKYSIITNKNREVFQKGSMNQKTVKSKMGVSTNLNRNTDNNLKLNLKPIVSKQVIQMVTKNYNSKKIPIKNKIVSNSVYKGLFRENVMFTPRSSNKNRKKLLLEIQKNLSSLQALKTETKELKEQINILKAELLRPLILRNLTSKLNISSSDELKSPENSHQEQDEQHLSEITGKSTEKSFYKELNVVLNEDITTEDNSEESVEEFTTESSERNNEYIVKKIYRPNVSFESPGKLKTNNTIQVLTLPEIINSIKKNKSSAYNLPSTSEVANKINDNSVLMMKNSGDQLQTSSVTLITRRTGKEELTTMPSFLCASCQTRHKIQNVDDMKNKQTDILGITATNETTRMTEIAMAKVDMVTECPAENGTEEDKDEMCSTSTLQANGYLFCHTVHRAKENYGECTTSDSCENNSKSEIQITTVCLKSSEHSSSEVTAEKSVCTCTKFQSSVCNSDVDSIESTGVTETKASESTIKMRTEIKCKEAAISVSTPAADNTQNEEITPKRNQMTNTDYHTTTKTTQVVTNVDTTESSEINNTVRSKNATTMPNFMETSVDGELMTTESNEAVTTMLFSPNTTQLRSSVTDEMNSSKTPKGKCKVIPIVFSVKTQIITNVSAHVEECNPLNKVRIINVTEDSNKTEIISGDADDSRNKRKYVKTNVVFGKPISKKVQKQNANGEIVLTKNDSFYSGLNNNDIHQKEFQVQALSKDRTGMIIPENSNGEVVNIVIKNPVFNYTQQNKIPISLTTDVEMKQQIINDTSKSNNNTVNNKLNTTNKTSTEENARNSTVGRKFGVKELNIYQFLLTTINNEQSITESLQTKSKKQKQTTVMKTTTSDVPNELDKAFQKSITKVNSQTHDKKVISPDLNNKTFNNSITTEQYILARNVSNFLKNNNLISIDSLLEPLLNLPICNGTQNKTIEYRFKKLNVTTKQNESDIFEIPNSVSNNNVNNKTEVNSNKTQNLTDNKCFKKKNNDNDSIENNDIGKNEENNEHLKLNGDSSGKRKNNFTIQVSFIEKPEPEVHISSFNASDLLQNTKNLFDYNQISNNSKIKFISSEENSPKFSLHFIKPSINKDKKCKNKTTSNQDSSEVESDKIFNRISNNSKQNNEIEIGRDTFFNNLNDTKPLFQIQENYSQPHTNISLQSKSNTSNCNTEIFNNSIAPLYFYNESNYSNSDLKGINNLYISSAKNPEECEEKEINQEPSQKNDNGSSSISKTTVNYLNSNDQKLKKDKIDPNKTRANNNNNNEGLQKFKLKSNNFQLLEQIKYNRTTTTENDILIDTDNYYNDNKLITRKDNHEDNDKTEMLNKLTILQPLKQKNTSLNEVLFSTEDKNQRDDKHKNMKWRPTVSSSYTSSISYTLLPIFSKTNDDIINHFDKKFLSFNQFTQKRNTNDKKSSTKSFLELTGFNYDRNKEIENTFTTKQQYKEDENNNRENDMIRKQILFLNNKLLKQYLSLRNQNAVVLNQPLTENSSTLINNNNKYNLLSNKLQKNNYTNGKNRMKISYNNIQPRKSVQECYQEKLRKQLLQRTNLQMMNSNLNFQNDFNKFPIKNQYKNKDYRTKLNNNIVTNLHNDSKTNLVIPSTVTNNNNNNNAIKIISKPESLTRTDIISRLYSNNTNMQFELNPLLRKNNKKEVKMLPKNVLLYYKNGPNINSNEDSLNKLKENYLINLKNHRLENKENDYLHCTKLLKPPLYSAENLKNKLDVQRLNTDGFSHFRRPDFRNIGYLENENKKHIKNVKKYKIAKKRSQRRQFN